MLVLIKLKNGEIIDGECTYEHPPEQMEFTRQNGETFVVRLVGKADGLPYYHQEYEGTTASSVR